MELFTDILTGFLLICALGYTATTFLLYRAMQTVIARMLGGDTTFSIGAFFASLRVCGGIALEMFQHEWFDTVFFIPLLGLLNPSKCDHILQQPFEELIKSGELRFDVEERD